MSVHIEPLISFIAAPRVLGSMKATTIVTRGELKGRKAPYDIDDFRQTVENGRHPDGEEIKADMPRCTMSEADLADLFTFLKALPE